MEKLYEAPRKPYERPIVYDLGDLQELTRGGGPDKCSGSSDQFAPQILSPNFGDPFCP